MRKAFVYIIKNSINDYCYIGKTVNIIDRQKAHFKPDERKLTYFYNFIRTYGSEVLFPLEILFECESEKEAYRIERVVIHTHRMIGIPLFNMTDGGEGVQSENMTDDLRQKFSVNGKIGCATRWSKPGAHEYASMKAFETQALEHVKAAKKAATTKYITAAWANAEKRELRINSVQKGMKKRWSDENYALMQSKSHMKPETLVLIENIKEIQARVVAGENKDLIAAEYKVSIAILRRCLKRYS